MGKRLCGAGTCVRSGVRQVLGGLGYVTRCAERHDLAVHAALSVAFLVLDVAFGNGDRCVPVLFERRGVGSPVLSM